MGKKSDKRAARTAAAQSRDQEFFQAGLQDKRTLAHLKALPERRLLDVQQHALSSIRRPMDTNRAVAYVTLGALAQLIRERLTDPSEAGG